MARIVFFLGAGASVAAGAPLVGQFVEAIDRAHADGLVTPRAFERFVQLRQAAGRSNNIEELLRYAEHAEDAIEALSRVMADTLEARVLFDVHQGVPTSRDSQYGALAQILRAASRPPTGIAIVTVNYDVCAEVAISDAGLTAYYGLDAARGPGPTELTLSKLHGSLNWHGCAGTRCGYINAEPHIRESAQALHPIADRRAVHLQFRRAWTPALHACGRPEQQPLLVPPVERKEHYYGDMRTVWNHATRELNEAAHLLIIGYSFRPIDRAVNDLLLAANAGRPIRLTVANPCKATRARTIERFRAGRAASITAVECDSFQEALAASAAFMGTGP